MIFPPVPQNGRIPKEEARDKESAYKKYRQKADARTQDKKKKIDDHLTSHEVFASKLVNRTVTLEQELDEQEKRS